MKKILFLYIITFMLPSFSMDEETKASQLFQAIESNDVKKVKELIFSPPEINRKREKILLEVAKPETNEIYKIIYWWTKSGSEVNVRKFFKAAEEADIAEIKRLITDKNIGLTVNIPNYEGNTVLMIAVKNKNSNLAQELLNLGADINHQNDEGQTPLMLAIISNNSEMVTMLLNNCISSVVNIDIEDIENNTALLFAMQTHNKEIIESILAEVPNPFITNRKGKSAANFSTSSEEKKLLALAQGRFNLYKEINDSTSTKDNIEKIIVSELNAPNALKNITSLERNPLAVAIIKNRFDIVKMLIDKGADVNQKLGFGFGITPLILAVNKTNSEVVKFLLEKGADPKIVFTHPRKGINNMTPLMLAVQERNIEIIKMILASGVNPLLRDSTGKTALDYVQEISSESIISEEESNFLKETINLLFISYMHYFKQALNMLQKTLQK